MNYKSFVTWLLGAGVLVVGGVWLSSSLPAAQSPGRIQDATPAPNQATTAATPTVGTPTATPALITVNTPTVVTVTAQITDPTLLANGANLLRLGATSTQSTVLGVMHDDGLNGDAVANDKIFSFRMTFNEKTAGQIQLQVSAAFKGLLKRVTSDPMSINAWMEVVDSSAKIVFNYPSGWGSRLYENTYTLSSSATPPTREGDPGNELRVYIFPLNGAKTITEWLNARYTGPLSISTKPITYFTNSFGVTFAIIDGVPGFDDDNRAAYTIVNGKVIQVYVAPASIYSSHFTSLLSSFKSK